MKVLYGNPKTIMAIGVGMIGDVPTPFIAFVDKTTVDGDVSFISGPDTTALVDKIDALGGVIIYIENPEAAKRLSMFMSYLFSNAVDGDWGKLTQSGGPLQ